MREISWIHTSPETAESDLRHYRKFLSRYSDHKSWPNWDVWRAMIVHCRMYLWAKKNKCLKILLDWTNQIDHLEEAKIAEEIAREENRGFYYTERWRNLRYAVFKKHGRRCMVCGATQFDAQIHVDHIKPRSKFPELQWDIDNLQVLCEDCNLGKSDRDQTDWRGA